MAYTKPAPAAARPAPAPAQPTPVEPLNSGIFTGIRVNILSVEGTTKALCSVKVAECFFITGIRIVEGKNGLFVSMPSRKNEKGEYQDICFPAAKAWRDELSGLLLHTYHAADNIPR